MKKLIVIGAIAASAVGFGAEASYLAQVYDVAITMKTGVCKAGKATAATVKYYEAYLGKGNAPFDKGMEMGFRSQSTRKITGVIWGCDCETIAFPAWRVYLSRGNYNLGGYAFWDQTANTYFVLPNTRFAWDCLNRITKDFKTVEGAWRLGNNVPRQAMSLTGAGFGKASIASMPCRSIVSKISGSFGGFRLPGLDDLVSDCPYCGVGNCNVRPFCEWCNFWTPARFLTAAYGSWSIKFNKSAANRLAKNMRITQSYTFKKAGALPTVLGRMEAAVQLLGRNGLLDNNNWIVSNDGRAAALLTRPQVMVAYAYGLVPDAVNITKVDGQGVVIINFNRLFSGAFALDEDEAAEEFDLEDEDAADQLEAAYLAISEDGSVTLEDAFQAYVEELDAEDEWAMVYLDDDGEPHCKKCGSWENGADPEGEGVANWTQRFYEELTAFVDAS